MLGRARHGPGWLLAPMGLFGAAFPGLIVAYFTSADLSGGLTAEPWVRGLVLGAASWTAIALLVLVARVRGSSGMAWLAAISFALYYWFAAGGIASELGWGSLGRDVIRVAAGLLLAWWAWRARSRLVGRRPAPAAPPGNG